MNEALASLFDNCATAPGALGCGLRLPDRTSRVRSFHADCPNDSLEKAMLHLASASALLASHDLAGRRVVVVGGGRVAARRTRRLAEAGAQVVVVAPTVDGSIAALGVDVESRRYADGDLEGAWLALACTDDPAVNAAVAAEAEERGIWCVPADDAVSSAAWQPAATAVDEVTVAVSAKLVLY